MAIRARKFEVTIPTVSDVTSIYKIKETGYANQEDSETLLFGIQTGELQDLAVPGTSIGLQMIKDRLSISIPGPGYFQYEIQWIQPVSTFNLGVGVVQDITDQIGATPATARITLTDKTIPNALYLLNAQVNISYQGQTVFRGYVTDHDFSSSTGQTGTTIMTLQDVRWLWSGIFIGQKVMSGSYDQRNFFDVLFNEAELPNREAVSGLSFDRGTIQTSSPDQRFWTYGTALTALLTWYNIGTLIGGVTEFVASLPHKDDLVHELDCQGQSLLTIVDQLVSAGPEVSWRLDFTKDPVNIVAVKQTSSAFRLFNYRTSVLDNNYATQCNVRRSISSVFTDAEVQSSKVLLETHFSGDTHWDSNTPLSDDYLLCFTLKGDAITSIISTVWGTGRGATNISAELHHTLVTRDDPDTNLPFSAPISDVDLARASEKPPFLWASLDGGSTFIQVGSDFDIDFKYGRVYIVKDTKDVNISPVINFVTGPKPVTDISLVKIAMTVSVVADFRDNLTALFTNSLTRKRTKLQVENKILSEYRMKTKFPDATAGIGSEVDPTLTRYVDPTDKLQEVLDRIKVSGGSDQLTGNVVVPFAPYTAPGDKVFVNNFLKWPTEDMFILSQTLNMQKGKMTLTVNCANQFWQTQNGLQKNPYPTWVLAKKIQDSFITGRSM